MLYSAWALTLSISHFMAHGTKACGLSFTWKMDDRGRVQPMLLTQAVCFCEFGAALGKRGNAEGPEEESTHDPNPNQP